MLRKIAVTLVIAALVMPSTAAFAQQKKWELSGTVGYKFGGGFDTQFNNGPNFRANLKSGVNYGFALGYNVNRQFMLEFAWNQQASALNVRPLNGGAETTAFDMKIDQFHGNFIWHAYNRNPKLRPYVLLGLGATVFNPSAEFSSTSRFSFALGGGVKADVSDSVGVKLQGRWTPTYISSSPGGVWCDPFFCWQTVNNQYAGQWDVTGSLVLKF